MPAIYEGPLRVNTVPLWRNLSEIGRTARFDHGRARSGLGWHRVNGRCTILVARWLACFQVTWAERSGASHMVERRQQNGESSWVRGM
jgi:hypothetical protein